MAIGVRVEPEHLVAAAGADIDGAVVLSNQGGMPVHVRLVLTSEVAGWASIEPSDLWVGAGGEARCGLRFRLPRGAPGGVGAVPFLVRVLSDQEGEGGSSATGTLDVIGEAELALRLLPATFRGTMTGTTRVAVDNLGETPARAQLVVEAPEGVAVIVEPDSLIIESNSTSFARVTVRPRSRLVTGPSARHDFWLRVDPLGGARISAPGTMVQRSLVAGLFPKVAAGLVGFALLAFVVVRAAGGGGGGDAQVDATAPVTTLTPVTTTTAAPSTTTTAAVTAAGATTTSIAFKDRRIAFQTKRDGNYEIYSARPDGSDAKNLTNSPSHDGEPVWSPDHSRIAFDSDRAGGFDVFVMNADGTNPVQITNEPAPDGYPTWSPDGMKLAFTSFRDGNSEIYVVNADGSNPIRLTKNLADDSHPAWSPDGTRIAFHSDRDSNYEIYVMNADGSNQHDVSNTPAADKNPSWSPNNARLAFDSTRDGSKSEIYVMGADGTLPTRLTTNDDLDDGPVWSPEGGRLLFQSDRDSDLELYEMAAGGGTPKRITAVPGEDAEPAW